MLFGGLPVPLLLGHRGAAYAAGDFIGRAQAMVRVDSRATTFRDLKASPWRWERISSGHIDNVRMLVIAYVHLCVVDG